MIPFLKAPQNFKKRPYTFLISSLPHVDSTITKNLPMNHGVNDWQFLSRNLSWMLFLHVGA